MARPKSLFSDIEDEIVLPKDRFVKDIFGQLRSISRECLEHRAEVEDVTARENANEWRRCRPTLERSLSHETTLKRQKREHYRMSLNDELLLHSEWSMYSPEELKILDFVVRKASQEDKSANKGRKTGSKLQKFRIHRPKIFSKNANSTKSKKSSTVPESTENSNKKSITENEITEEKITPRKTSFIKRFIESATHLKSPSTSPKLGRRRQSNEIERRNSGATADANLTQSRRRPTGNFQVHALLQEEVKRSSSLQCLSASSFSVADEIEKARGDAVAGKTELHTVLSDSQIRSREPKEKAKVTRTPNVRRNVDNYQEDAETFFERYEHFCKNPIMLANATEANC